MGLYKIFILEREDFFLTLLWTPMFPVIILFNIFNFPLTSNVSHKISTIK